TEYGTDVVDPALAPVAGPELRAERPRRVHRRAGQRTADIDVDRDREADRETGNRLERAARVDRGRPHGPDEEERHDQLEQDALAGAEDRRVRDGADDRLVEEAAQERSGDKGTGELRDPVDDGEPRRDPFGREEPERDRR